MFKIFKKKPVLHPDYPVVEGLYEMTPEWRVVLPLPFNRRIEDGSLVLWRPGITAWVIVWGNDHSESADARIRALKLRRAPQAFGEQELKRYGVHYYLYRLAEEADDRRVPAAYAFAFADVGHVQMAIYFDSENDLPLVESLWTGLKPTSRPGFQEQVQPLS